MNDNSNTSEENIRRQKYEQLIAEGYTLHDNSFKPTAIAKEIHDEFTTTLREELQEKKVTVSCAGRILTKRDMGKAAFCNLHDASGKIQIYIKQSELDTASLAYFKALDIGDIIGITGILFKTKTNELTIRANKISILTKSLKPWPEKFHGIVDKEMRQRRRYLDLIVNPQSKETFITRSQAIRRIREYLTENDFLEVETPMMHNMAGGAAAKPFVTHHNTLDMTLYLRIAPELYLKRLVVGGLEKVFEINRNFRNEGISTSHNPEFTMLEFYEAYSDYKQAMARVEQLIYHVVTTATPNQDINKIHFLDHEISFQPPFKKLTMREAIVEYNNDIQMEDLKDVSSLANIFSKHNIEHDANDSFGTMINKIFEETVEEKLIQPCFITEFPIEVSPLARTKQDDARFVDRAELFCCGYEIANLFSELNDANEQRKRFQQQTEAKKAGDEEAMPYDEDYLIALEHGLYPCAGVGIGIDRLIMLMTNSSSIRDVILFPQLRDKK